MNTPGQNPHRISDLVPGVIEALENRQDITQQQAAIWIKKTLINLTETEVFEELRTTGPLVNIGPGLGYNGSNYVYPVSYFLNAGDDCTLTEDPVIFLSPTAAASAGLIGVGTTTGGTVGYPMNYMTPKAIAPLLFIPGGVPFRYTRYGQFLWFGSQPGQNYQIYLPYQIRHPFSDSNLSSSQLFIPPSWEDVVEYSAALRGAHAKRWPDMVKYLREIVYGDPKDPSQPGLLKSLKMQIERDEGKSTRQLMPVVARY
jgi:hypothetical protein